MKINQVQLNKNIILIYILNKYFYIFYTNNL